MTTKQTCWVYVNIFGEIGPYLLNLRDAKNLVKIFRSRGDQAPITIELI